MMSWAVGTLCAALAGVLVAPSLKLSALPLTLLVVHDLGSRERPSSATAASYKVGSAVKDAQGVAVGQITGTSTGADGSRPQFVRRFPCRLTAEASEHP